MMQEFYLECARRALAATKNPQADSKEVLGWLCCIETMANMRTLLERAQDVVRRKERAGAEPPLG